MFYKNLKNPPKKYRPAPFWSWNEKLDVAETVRQVHEMDEVGIGGYFMHARGGLQTEYMSDEWFQNISATVEEGEKLGMRSWGYDENGWPSGFGSGAVNGLGLKYQQKYLRYKETDAPENTEKTIINIPYNGKNIHFYYIVNPFYVDTLDGEVTEEFLRSTHELYKEKLGDKFTKMDGFFTDEPQVSRDGLPWSFILEREYQKAYGEPLAPNMLGLYFEVEGYAKVRYNFWKLVRDLFAENFMGKIYNWCNENGSALTGHLVIEEGFWAHILASACCMPSYENMHIPGMDHLGRSLASIQTEMQLSSVANQMGKKQILSETFAMCGWDVSFEELRWIYEHQMVHGINYLCQHLEGYTLRGIRKRDYPATLFKQQPWWSEYRIFNDMVSRIGMMLADGEIDFPILVLHTIESAWVKFDNVNSEICNKIRDDMLRTMVALENSQLQYHLGDGRIMQRHAKVENGQLKIGTQSYKVVVVPPANCLGKFTFELLQEFKAQGGLVIFAGEVPTMLDGVETDEIVKFAENCVNTDFENLPSVIPADCRKLTLNYDKTEDDSPVYSTYRYFPREKMTMYYLVNSFMTERNATVTVKGKSATVFDYLIGEEVPAVYSKNGDNVDIEITIPKRGSVVVFAYDEAEKPSAHKCNKELIPLGDTLKGEWEITNITDNTLTLDYCDVYFDGELKYENLPISDVQELACAFKRKVNTKVVFKFNVKEIGFKRMELVVETPEIFDITLNGKPVEKKVTGYFCDTSFKTIDIFGGVVEGENTLELTCDFEQSEKTYENTEKSLQFESEKNKLSYDMEIEAVYLKGDFAVKTDNKFEHIERRGLRVDGDFYITSAQNKVNDGNLAEQGYPFFSGSITLKKKITLTAEEIENRSFNLAKLSTTVTKVKVNGKDAGDIMWHPYSVDLSGLLLEGENEIEVTLIGNLRNLLGPFHMKEGECHSVGPGRFFHNSPIWVKGVHPNWTDTYCFVECGLFF